MDRRDTEFDDALTLCAHLARLTADHANIPTPHQIGRAVHQLQRRSRMLQRLNEWQCSYPGFGDKQEHRQERIEAECKAIAAELGITATFNRDPRGRPIRLHLTDTTGRPIANCIDDTWRI